MKYGLTPEQIDDLKDLYVERGHGDNYDQQKI